MRPTATAIAAVALALTAAACQGSPKPSAEAATSSAVGQTGVGSPAPTTNASPAAVGTSAAPTSAAPASAPATSASSPATTTSHDASGAVKVDVCALLPQAKASALMGKAYTQAVSSTISTGQDQCSYTLPDAHSLVVIVYQPGSGVTWQMMTDVLATTGDPKPVSGIGERAMIGADELDAQVGTRLLAVRGPGLINDESAQAVAVAKAVIAAL